MVITGIVHVSCDFCFYFINFKDILINAFKKLLNILNFLHPYYLRGCACFHSLFFFNNQQFLLLKVTFLSVYIFQVNKCKYFSYCPNLFICSLIIVTNLFLPWSSILNFKPSLINLKFFWPTTELNAPK